MPYGYTGKIARVDLSSGTVSVEEKGWTFYRKYLGGRGIVAHYLLNEVPADADPLGPENRLVFAASVVGGVPIPGTGRHSAGAKSPLTGFYGDSEAGGFWGAELKFAGFDAIVVQGRAAKPVYLSVRDGEIEIRDASRLWGMDTGDTRKAIARELEEKGIRIVAIGKAGENLVRYAGITSDLQHYHGRTGLGAVMGSKKLKAIVVKGSGKPEVAHPERVKALIRYFMDHYKENGVGGSWRFYGTTQLYWMFAEGGILPTRNFASGDFPGGATVNLDQAHETYKAKQETCFACPVRCKMSMKAEKPWKVDPLYGGPEYETLGSFLSCCGVNDFVAAAKAHELCNRYGLDTISTGVTIAFAMECFENGIITKEDTDGLELRFGNADAMLAMVEKIASRDGFGDLLAEGSRRAAERIGKGAERFSMTTKSKEFPMHEPRNKFGVGLAYAVSPVGADHLQHEHDPGFDIDPLWDGTDPEKAPGLMKEVYQLGLLEPVANLSLSPEKVRLFTYLQSFWNIHNCLGLCIFNFAPSGTYHASQIAEIVSAVTGWDVSLWELMKTGERVSTMMRCFNLKHGMTRKDDTLPARMFDGLEGGANKGIGIGKEDLDRAISLYYEMSGWDRETGIPTEGRLYELDLGWATGMRQGTPGQEPSAAAVRS